MRFDVLGSGSQGNASLVQADGPGLLIDVGLTPRVLEERLGRLGAGWDQIGAAVLTHTHRDHVARGTLGRLANRGIRVYCHEAHRAALAESGEVHEVERRGLLRTYDDRPWLTGGGLRLEPVEAYHDDAATFGFRIEGRVGRGRSLSVGYLADTGMWTARQADALADVDLLAVEFNHDVELQKASGRPAFLIRRVMGHRGHLSNEQGGELLRAVLSRSRPGRPNVVVLLHLSAECNRPGLAMEAAREALSDIPRRIEVHVARADKPSPDLRLDRPRSGAGQRRPGRRLVPVRRRVDCPTWF
jgi:phosphoribosyl 1,2-cyclic phosphodiesterase